MKIIVDIGHPGHVHFFKNFIWQMKERGHEILVTASETDVTLDLLDAYNIDYIISSRRYSGIMQGYELLRRDLQLYSLVRKFKPDVLMGINNTIAAHVSKVTRAKSIIFTDTEHAKIANAITFPFSDVICTPSCYKGDIGKKQIRYNGCHQLASLHPNSFTPNPAVLTELGLDKNDNIFLIRFAAFNASHDTKTEHFDKRYIPDLIGKLEDKGTVVISSEVKLEPYLQKYQYKLSPNRYHDLLYFSKMYIGEG